VTTNAGQPNPKQQPVILGVEIIDSRTALVRYQSADIRRDLVALGWGSAKTPRDRESGLTFEPPHESNWVPYGPKDKPENHEQENR